MMKKSPLLSVSAGKSCWCLLACAVSMVLPLSASAITTHGNYPDTVTQQDARDAWEYFKEQYLDAEATPGPDMLRAYWQGYGAPSTMGEFQGWALVLAVMHDDQETARKLWNFSKYYIPGQRDGLVPWLIKAPDDAAGSNVGDADFDYAIALDVAARKWPDFRFDDDDEHFGELADRSWGEWAEYYINRIYETQRARATNPESPNAISGKGFDTSRRAYARGRDEHYYLHYSPYGYLQNWAERTGNRNWVEPVGDLESVYEAEINLQKPTLAKYYGLSDTHPYCWPPHQVRKDGRAADDLINKYDSGWNLFNWGPGRITARACHAYLNSRDEHGEKMLRFLAERFLETSGGNPEGIKKGYRMDAYLKGDPFGAGCNGWGDPNLFHVGHAAMSFMVDPQYQDELNRYSAYMLSMDTTDKPAWALGKAYYLLHLTGMMDYRIE